MGARRNGGDFGFEIVGPWPKGHVGASVTGEIA